MELNKETIHITDDIFLRLRADMDKAMQYLLSNMIQKESSDGKISVNISVGLITMESRNQDWYIIQDLSMRSKQKCSLKRKKKV